MHLFVIKEEKHIIFFVEKLRKVDSCEISSIIHILESKKEHNRFILTYLNAFNDADDIIIYEYGGTYIANLKGLIISLSYTENPAPLIRTILEDMSFRMLIAPGEKMGKILSGIDADERRYETLMAYKRGEKTIESPARILDSLEEYHDLFEFYQGTDEYRNFYSYEDMARKFRERDEKHFASAVFCRCKPVSALFVNNGLIASVATATNERRKGYARENILGAIRYYFDRNREENRIYLFYNDNKVKGLYQGMGFYDVCPFTVIKRRLGK